MTRTGRTSRRWVFLAYLARRIEELPIALLLGIRTATLVTAPLEEILQASGTGLIAPPPLTQAGRGGAPAATPNPDVVAAAASRSVPDRVRSARAVMAWRRTERRLAELSPAGRSVGEAVALLAGAAEVATIAELSEPEV